MCSSPLKAIFIILSQLLYILLHLCFVVFIGNIWLSFCLFLGIYV